MKYFKIKFKRANKTYYLKIKNKDWKNKRENPDIIRLDYQGYIDVTTGFINNNTKGIINYIPNDTTLTEINKEEYELQKTITIL